MKTNCSHQSECMKLITRILDKEATAEEEARFLANKDHCLPCKEGHELEVALRKALKSSCHSKCPSSLLDSIRSKISSILLLILLLIPLFCWFI
jgi:CO dehydrogenase/acetyl-CoA synthase gamma subunit (corrinoid Fe-S protein)